MKIDYDKTTFSNTAREPNWMSIQMLLHQTRPISLHLKIIKRNRRE